MARVYLITEQPSLRRRTKAAFMKMCPARRAEYIKWWRSRDSEIYLSLTTLNVFATKELI